jgi:hypothetical protein
MARTARDWSIRRPVKTDLLPYLAGFGAISWLP